MTTTKYLPTDEALALWRAGRLTNGSAVSERAMQLPDGHRDAERVFQWQNKRKGTSGYTMCCPWLLCDVFSVPA